MVSQCDRLNKKVDATHLRAFYILCLYDKEKKLTMFH